MVLFPFYKYYVTVCFQSIAGLHSTAMLWTVLTGVAGAFAGQMLGIRMGRHINKAMFQRIVVLFLSAAAAILFARAF